MSRDVYKIAAIQATPVYMDREASLEEACHLIAEAAHKGAWLAVFPKCLYLPIRTGYGMCRQAKSL